MQMIPSTDGASIALHDLGGTADLPPLLISHATGFHAHCYQPIARAASDLFHAFGMDHRGHGLTPVPDGWDVDWTAFGEDALAVGRHLAPDGGLVGFGHSMGGAALLMAAHADPGLFERLVLFEPIAHPPMGHPFDMEEVPIVRGARRRRRRFDSFDDAIANYSAKPPLALMAPEVLRSYVEHGFRPAADGEGVELRCAPEYEASVFVGSRRSRLWDELDAIEVPALVIAGVIEEDQPSHRTEMIAELLPNGEFLGLPHQTHLGPFSHPGEIAVLIGDPSRSA